MNYDNRMNQRTVGHVGGPLGKARYSSGGPGGMNPANAGGRPPHNGRPRSATPILVAIAALIVLGALIWGLSRKSGGSATRQGAPVTPTTPSPALGRAPSSAPSPGRASAPATSEKSETAAEKSTGGYFEFSDAVFAQAEKNRQALVATANEAMKRLHVKGAEALESADSAPSTQNAFLEQWVRNAAKAAKSAKTAASKGAGNSPRTLKEMLSGEAPKTPEKPLVDFSDPIVREAIKSYLAPDEAYLKQLLVAIEGSQHVREKFADIAGSVVFEYLPDDDLVNAVAYEAAGKDGAPERRIRLYGGLVRIARILGAVFSFGEPARQPESDLDLVFVKELGATIREGGGKFSRDNVIDFLKRYKVDPAGFTSRVKRSKAEVTADAVVKATLAHEFGHHAKGHLKGGDVNHVVSQIEEKEADLFASAIAASDPHGYEFFMGQIYSMIVFAFADADGGTSLRTHPVSRERVIDVIRANPEWAEAAGLTEEGVRDFFNKNASPEASSQTSASTVRKSAEKALAPAGVRGGQDATIILPGGRKTLVAGSAATRRKELVARGKSLMDDTSKSVYIVKADPSVAASKVRRAIEAAGAENLRYVPGGAWLVRGTQAQYRDILENDFFDATRSYEADDKGVELPAPGEGEKGFVPGAPAGAIYVVSLFKGADAAAIRGKLSATAGCELLSAEDETIRVRATGTAFHKVCALTDVESVTEWFEPRLNNNYAVNAMRVSSVWPAAASAQSATSGVSQAASLGLTGKGQIVAVCDTGLDSGNLQTLHPDVRGRVVKAFAYGRPSNINTWAGDWSDHKGHGSHVVGSVLGNGAASSGKIKGGAFEASLLMQSHADAQGKLSGLYRRGIDGLLHDAYSFKAESGNSARIHSDSWGAPVYGEYYVNSENFDAMTFVCPDFLTVVSAGNEGVDHKEPFGIVDYGSIGSPGTAKNCLTVGAAESGRTSGGSSKDPWGEGWPPDFPHDPIKSDLISSSASGLRGMAAFSSRGPCRDGRIKPDIVAPGTDILSIRSQARKELPDTWGPYNEYYHYMGGTSMACPLVSGTAALVRQWLVEKRGIANPDAATMKAVLCAGAKSLHPGQYGEGKFLEIPKTYPNNVEGWGMVNLENSVANPDGVAVWDGEVIAEEEARTFNVTAPGGKPLCILMAYSDFPSQNKVGGLVNDIDLTVTDPSGKVWYPNSLSHPDRVNNVEGVRWDKAPAGVYVVTVSQPPNGGINWPMDPKFTGGKANAIRFSLVANGASSAK